MIHHKLLPPQKPLLPHIISPPHTLFELYRSIHAIRQREKCAGKEKTLSSRPGDLGHRRAMTEKFTAAPRTCSAIFMAYSLSMASITAFFIIFLQLISHLTSSFFYVEVWFHQFGSFCGSFITTLPKAGEAIPRFQFSAYQAQKELEFTLTSFPTLTVLKGGLCKYLYALASPMSIIFIMSCTSKNSLSRYSAGQALKISFIEEPPLYSVLSCPGKDFQSYQSAAPLSGNVLCISCNSRFRIFSPFA